MHIDHQNAPNQNNRDKNIKEKECGANLKTGNNEVRNYDYDTLKMSIIRELKTTELNPHTYFSNPSVLLNPIKELDGIMNAITEFGYNPEEGITFSVYFRRYEEIFRKNVMDARLVDCEFTIPYLDDMLIKSESRDQHVEHVKCVFEKIRDYSFTLNEQKCEFFSPKIKYLGQSIDRNG
ncbi:uncharacterized protein LOC106878577 [Octopus bimaculoides]|uniref:uncharacterized protein LOC106878577 n=1 Tax=Octopus bimaculoides TaxID=37653 RepID=UPI00071E0CBC|nr:uncharacterized protein LOC106878577 [Octopus bimaculoides]|eukprot:XP_014783308.1 PREDICTED: uncharacterized protein LOC106878577 [Octopus bimaculoides]